MHKHVKQGVKELDGYPNNPIPIGGLIPEYVHTVLKHVMSNFADSSQQVQSTFYIRPNMCSLLKIKQSNITGT